MMPGRWPMSNRGQLSSDRIVDAAVDLARREGLDRVSMRRLGRELGVEPMSLYYHVPGKATLLVLMADRALSGLTTGDPSRPWDERLVELLVSTYQAGVDNPAVFTVLASQAAAPAKVPAAPEDPVASLQVITAVEDLLAESPLPADIRGHAHRGLIGLLVGLLVVQVDGLHRIPGPGPGLPVNESPDAGQLRAAPVNLIEDLRFSVQLLVDGLKRRPPPG